ncbi:MAG: NAD-dependent epimerase/dehydratase family protein [Deltaproteobacteria bacterium]|nr:NAD-dependent epimerase/dehydratase family protein [Deltaproteobacteria bacterium]
MSAQPAWRDPAQVEKLGACLVTGGGGYFGRLLANRLLELGLEVRVLDVSRHPKLCADVEFVHADVRDAAAVERATRGCRCVFHTAAIIDGVTYASSKRRARIDSINVGGTENVLNAARASGVTRVVHTSSNNVVFDREIELGDESERYAEGRLDLYTASKIEAERRVLAARGGDLATTALRPGGIYGPGERHHLPRLVRELLGGRFVATVGDGTARADNIYIDNLIDAHLAAALSLKPGSASDGHAYFISDGAPANYFEFFRPLIEDLGYSFPRAKMPRWLMRALALGAEWVSRVFGAPEPFLTLMEVRKISVTHTFRIDGAARDLGYRPAVSQAEGVRRCLPWVRALKEAGGDADAAEALLG